MTLKGRELDAAVQLQIFGPWDESRCRVCGCPLHNLLSQGCTPESCSLRPPPERRADEPGHFPTDIAAAFSVVEKMREEGFNVTLEDGLDGTWECTLHGHKRTSRASGATLPEAICLAALEAKGAGK